MLITKEEIIQDIKTQYQGNTKEFYNLVSRIKKEDESIIESNNIIVVPDIHGIDEKFLDISKKIYLLNLNNFRQTSTRNYQLMFNSLRALGEKNVVQDIFKELEEMNPIYTKNFLLRENWTDLKTFFNITNLIKKYTKNPDPRSFERMGMFAGLDDETLRLIDIYEGDKAKLSLKEKINEIMTQFASVNDVYGLAPTKNRSVNYDLIFQHITTNIKKDSKNKQFNTVYLSKYFENFRGDITWDHEWWVNGIWRGLAARKKRGFADLETKYFFDSMEEVLNKSYNYDLFDIKKTNSKDNITIINGKEISHEVILEKKEIKCNSSIITQFLSAPFQKKRFVYDPTPIEISSLSRGEIKLGLNNGKYVKVTHIDEKLVDSSGRLIFDKGNMLGGPYTYSVLKYSNEKIQDPDLDLFSNLFETKKIEIDISSNKKRKIEGAKQRAELRKRFIDLMDSLESERFMRENLEELVDERTKQLKQANQNLKSAYSKLEKAKEVEDYLNQQLRIQDVLQTGEDIGAQVLHENKNLLTPLVNLVTRVRRLVNINSKLLDVTKNYANESEKKDVGNVEYLMDATKETLVNAEVAYKEIMQSYENFRQVYNPKESGDKDLNRDLDACVNLMIDRNYKSYITIIKDFNEVKIPETYDSSKFNNGIFIDLIKNARDAIIEEKNNSDGNYKGEILIRTVTNNNKTKIKIYDNGIGVPENYIEKMFQKKETSKKSGTGLGLYTAKFIMDELKCGKIYYEKSDVAKYKTLMVVELNLDG
jgi:signal transduction histidine kinase